MQETSVKRGPGRPRATGPCAKCGGTEFSLRRKVTKRVNAAGTVVTSETMSRQCVPCTRRLRTAAKARKRMALSA